MPPVRLRPAPLLLPLLIASAAVAIAPRAEASTPADRLFRFAMALAAREDLTRAAEEFRRFVERHADDPRAPEAGFRLAYSLHKTSRSAEAARILGDWVKKHPHHELADRAMYWHGDALSETGKISEARTAWRTLVTRFPKSIRAPYALDSAAWLHFRAGEYKQSLNLYKWLRERYREPKGLVEGAARHVAECLLELGRAEEALAAFESLLAKKPRGRLAVDVRYGRARALQSLGRAAEAAREFETVIAAARKSSRSASLLPDAMLSLATALVDMGNDAKKAREALDVIDELAALEDADAAKARSGLVRGLAFEALGRDKDAAVAYSATLGSPQARAVHARAAWQLAELRYRSKDPTAAVAAYDRVISLGGTTNLVEKSLYNSALTLAEAGRHEEALSRALRLCRDFPSGAHAADARHACGQFLMKLKRWREAARAYGDFLARHPNDRRASEARYNRGWCLNAAGSFDAARAEFDLLLKTDPEGPAAAEAAFLLADSARKSDRLDEARRAYRAVLKMKATPERAADALWALASMAHDAKRGPEARELSLRLVKDCPSSRLVPWAMRLAADCALKTGDAEGAKKALVEFRALLKKFPSHELAPAARSGEAWSLKTLGRSRDAIYAFRTLAHEHPTSRFATEALFRAAELLRAERRYDEAASALDEILRKDPDGRFAEAALFERARVLVGKGELDGAIRALTVFAKRFPQSDLMPEALKELALSHFEKKDRAGERAAWQRIVEEFPSSPIVFDAHWGLAALNEEGSRFASAAQGYARAAAVRKNPQAAEAALRSAECLVRASKLNEARRVFASIPRDFPESDPRRVRGRALARAGALALEAGDARAAEPFLRRAEELAPGTATVGLAAALRRSGKPAEAAKLLAAYVKRGNGSSADGSGGGASGKVKRRMARLELALATVDLGRHRDA
ncbi:MAG: tetratricopeptide repeat protein, partial [Planctomycetota bacterium]